MVSEETTEETTNERVEIIEQAAFSGLTDRRPEMLGFTGVGVSLLGLLLIGGRLGSVQTAPHTHSRELSLPDPDLSHGDTADGPLSPDRTRRHADSERDEEEELLPLDVPTLKIQLERRIQDLEEKKKLAKKYNKSSKKELKRLKKRLKKLKSLESGEEGNDDSEEEVAGVSLDSLDSEERVDSAEQTLVSAIGSVMREVELALKETRCRCEKDGRQAIQTAWPDFHIVIKVENRADNSQSAIIVATNVEESEATVKQVEGEGEGEGEGFEDSLLHTENPIDGGGGVETWTSIITDSPLRSETTARDALSTDGYAGPLLGHSDVNVDSEESTTEITTTLLPWWSLVDTDDADTLATTEEIEETTL